jgi:hypothetical protein
VLWFRHLIPFAVLAAVTVGGVAVYHQGQRRLDTWLRAKLAEELAKENLRADIGRMTLDPLRGLVARDCRLYGGPDQKLLLATFDRLRVEGDVSRLLQRQQFISSLELTDAALSLPLDPEDPQTGWLTLSGLTARILASGDRFEVRQARGELEGIPVTVEGTLLKPARMGRSRTRPPGEKREALDLLRDRRIWLDSLRAQIRQLDWRGSSRPPRLELRLNGDLDRPSEMQLRARLRGADFRYRDYTVKEIDLVAEWSRGETLFREILLRDNAGTLTGNARLGPGRSGLNFSFQSSANLPALAGAVHDLPALREFVLYEPDALSITGEGSWRPASPDGATPASFRMLGRIASGRFATRGAVFDSIDGSFFVQDGDFNLRDLRLAHETGTLDGQVMRQNGLWRYRTQMRMNPKALQPFMATADLHRLMDRLDFQDHSTMELEAHGSGRPENPASWEHQAAVEARQFRYQGEVVHRVQATVKRSAGTTAIQGVRLVRPEGEITAARLTLDDASQTLLIDDLRSTVFPLPVVQCINPHIVPFVRAYQFSKPPTIRMAGRVGMKMAEPNDFTLDVTTDGEVLATLPDRTVLPLASPRGQITSKGIILSLDLTGQVRSGASWQGTTLDDTASARFLGSFPVVSVNPPSETWQFFLTGPMRARQKVGTTTLPLEVTKATVDFRHRRGDLPGATVQVEADGRLLAPLRFQMLSLRDPAAARFQGIFEAEKRTTEANRNRWSLIVESPGIVDCELGGKLLPLEKLRLQADFRRDRLDIPRATAGLFGGMVTGTGEVDRLASTQDFIAAVQADNVSFGPLARVYSPGSATEGQLAGGFRLAGRGQPAAAETKNLRGAGQMTIRDGDIFALPLLGPLSPLLSAVLPGTKTGYSKARQANATFALENGVLTTRDFEALTGAFVIKGGGQVNLDTSRVDLMARINTRGPTGMLLYPVSRLLEYEAAGTTADPAWKPAVLTLPGKLIPLPGVRRR